MGIGPGIVTKSAKRPKYRLDAAPKRAMSEMLNRRRYLVVYRVCPSGLVKIDMYPRFNYREKRVARKLEMELGEKNYGEFRRALCNRIEKIDFARGPSAKIESIVDDFIRQFPRWEPERNHIRKTLRRLPWQTKTNTDRSTVWQMPR